MSIHHLLGLIFGTPLEAAGMHIYLYINDYIHTGPCLNTGSQWIVKMNRVPLKQGLGNRQYIMIIMYIVLLEGL